MMAKCTQGIFSLLIFGLGMDMWVGEGFQEEARDRRNLCFPTERHFFEIVKVTPRPHGECFAHYSGPSLSRLLGPLPVWLAVLRGGCRVASPLLPDSGTRRAHSPASLSEDGDSQACVCVLCHRSLGPARGATPNWNGLGHFQLESSESRESGVVFIRCRDRNHSCHS